MLHAALGRMWRTNPRVALKSFHSLLKHIWRFPTARPRLAPFAISSRSRLSSGRTSVSADDELLRTIKESVNESENIALGG